MDKNQLIIKQNYYEKPNLVSIIFMNGQVENNNAKTLNYVLTDHLGSPVYILDELGGVLEEQNFDPWGRRRNPQTWTYESIAATHLFSRGFTGHEQLDAFKLIDMKGRMYDPAVGRFLSADPTIQFHENSQSYNRYSYALNNPLRFTDPSGFSVDWFINEITGDVYYNSEYKKGDESKIKGEGWKWFGDDDVFGMDAWSVIWQNRTLFNSVRFSTGGFNLEASFKGQNALTFMKNMGYEFNSVGSSGGGTPWYSIYNWPALGSSARTMDALYAGNYLNAGIQFVTCAAEVFTFGNASELNLGANTETETQIFKSVGAAGKQVFNPKNFKGVSESLLKRNGISDIHAFKADWLGTNKGLKYFDVVKHSGSNELLIIRKSTQEVVERTYIIIK